PWPYAVSTCAPQEARRHLDRAFACCFARVRLRNAGQYHGTLGYPKRTSRKRGLGSLRLTGSSVVFPEAMQVPRRGCLRLKEHRYAPTSGVRVRMATVSEHAGQWSVSVLVEQEHVVPEPAGPVVGVDLGVTRLATRSDGQLAANPSQPLQHHCNTITRLR